jgi:hypothetical protein
MKVILAALFTVIVLVSATIPKSESPYYFFAHDGEVLRSRINYVSSGATMSNYQLDYYKSWDSCLIRINELGLIIPMDDYIFDQGAMIDSVKKYGLDSILYKVTIKGQTLDSNYVLNLFYPPDTLDY